MKYSREINAVIKKLNKIYKSGYMPSREKERYGELHSIMINCYGHACFNLTNSDLSKEFDDTNIIDLGRFILDFRDVSIQNHIIEAKKRIEKVGLKLEKSSLFEKIKKNQWKIAYYVDDGDEYYKGDYHYMIQLNDGKWASKRGQYSDVEVYDELPKVFEGIYNLIGVYKITNPYAKMENEENMEM